MMLVTAPQRVSGSILAMNRCVFLAGSIEMGSAVEWQRVVIDAMLPFSNVALFNPRRPDWDSSWKQEASNAQFAEQVNWELDMLEECDVAFFYFDPATKSPITLLELGNVAHAKHEIIVVCPEGYWRRGNVEIFCQRQHIEFLGTLEEGIARLKELV